MVFGGVLLGFFLLFGFFIREKEYELFICSLRDKCCHKSHITFLCMLKSSI